MASGTVSESKTKTPAGTTTPTRAYRTLCSSDINKPGVCWRFYNSFRGIEPKLLQLSNNYRSHAGVLRLAACVVELLYYHFFGNSLDKLPPDLGLVS